MIENGVVLVDSDLRRRREIARILQAKGLYVEPYEDSDEYAGYPLRAALYLLADEGSDLLRMLEALDCYPGSPNVIAYGGAVEAQRIVDAMRLGVGNYLVWPFAASALDAAIGDVGAHQANVSQIRSRVNRARLRLRKLSGRELQVLELVAEGYSSKETGIQLVISPRTVEIHRANIMLKLQAKNFAQALRLAVEGSLGEETDTRALLLA